MPIMLATYSTNEEIHLWHDVFSKERCLWLDVHCVTLYVIQQTKLSSPIRDFDERTTKFHVFVVWVSRRSGRRNCCRTRCQYYYIWWLINTSECYSYEFVSTVLSKSSSSSSWAVASLHHVDGLASLPVSSDRQQSGRCSPGSVRATWYLNRVISEKKLTTLAKKWDKTDDII